MLPTNRTNQFPRIAKILQVEPPVPPKIPNLSASGVSLEEWLLKLSGFGRKNEAEVGYAGLWSFVILIASNN